MDTLPITGLYPPLSPFSDGMLAVGDGHEIFWEQSGMPTGVPVIYLHGGPGSGCVPAHRRFFDPDRYRIVLMDQRGCGRSRPMCTVDANTTQALIADIEKLRRHLGISKWLVVGGSWGSTLAVAYGQAHPDSCLGFLLRGVFLFEEAEVDWFLHGMGRFFPEARERWLAHLPEDKRSNPLQAYHQLLLDPDPAIHGPAAHYWNAYETACSTLLGPTSGDMFWTMPDKIPNDVLALARLEAHYMVNGGFFQPKQLMNNMDKIAHLPCVIVQGRYDVVCPIETAYKLHHAWPQSQLNVIADAGHAVFETGIRSAMVAHLNRYAGDFYVRKSSQV